MNIRFFSLFFLILFGISGIFFPALAHEGIPFEADGCHECLAEDGCFFFDYWSVPRITRHCHGIPKAIAATTSISISREAKKSASDSREARVLRVLSGDEIEVEFEDDKNRALVQMLGIRNPAAYEAEDSPLCRDKMEKEAQERLEDAALDKKVTLRPGLRGEDALKDGTLLRAVLRKNSLINKEMLQGGYAMIDSDHAFEYVSEFTDAETSARKEGNGVWSPEFCEEKEKRALMAILLDQISRYQAFPAILQYTLATLGVLGIYAAGRLIRRSRVTV